MAGELPPNFACKWLPPLPQPTVGTGGVASVGMSAHIAASPATCLQVVLDSTKYGIWNKFVREAQITKAAPAAAAAELGTSLGFLAGTDGKVEGMLLLGTEFTFTVWLDQNSDSTNKTHLVVTVLKEIEHEGKKGFRVAWAMNGGGWMQNVERTQDFIESADGGTDYYSKETFYGPVSYAIKTFVGGKLLKALDLWTEGLKNQAENQ